MRCGRIAARADGIFALGSFMATGKLAGFRVAYKFMKDFSWAAAQDQHFINRVWKYVVFAHNDRPDQLLRA